MYFFFYGEKLIGPLFILGIYEISNDLQYEILYFSWSGFSFFMAENECWISIWHNPDMKGDLLNVQERIY